MTLHDYIEAQGAGTISRLMRTTGCAATTLHGVLDGAPIARYELAKRIADATGGAVTVHELCDRDLVLADAKRHGRPYKKPKKARTKVAKKPAKSARAA